MVRENAFEHEKKKTRVKFNPRLSANRLSNNWALITRSMSQLINLRISINRGGAFMFSLQFIRGAKDTGKTSSMSQSVSLMRRSLHSCKFKG